MKKLLFILTLVILTKSPIVAQERPSILKTVDGQSIKGFVSNHAWVFNNNFKFYDSKKNFQKIKAVDYTSMVVDTIQYKVYKNRKGKPIFMRELISTGKAHLYVHESVITVEMSQSTVWDYYLVKKDKAYYIDFFKLKEFPERYFGGSNELIDEIRNTKRRHQKEKIRSWVQLYNKTMAN